MADAFANLAIAATADKYLLSTSPAPTMRSPANWPQTTD
jgi:hypothetical protein